MLSKTLTLVKARCPYEHSDSILPILTHITTQFLLKTDNGTDTLLTEICRERIRDNLLSPSGGNNNNLITAVSCLPLPKRLKD